MDDSFNFKTFKTTLMRILLILLLLFLSACHKPVYTEYYEKGNYSEFTTHPFLMEVPGYRILSVTASRRCPGKTICNPKEIKLTLRLETKFAYLQGKDFGILADGEKALTYIFPRANLEPRRDVPIKSGDWRKK